MNGHAAPSRLVPGPAEPADATPPRRPGSIRRTTSWDMSRPDGPFASLVVAVRGRDLLTDASGTPVTLERFAVELHIDQRSGRVTGVEAGAGVGAPELEGVGVHGGYGRTLAGLYPDEIGSRSLRYSALDDLGGAILVSGYDLLRNGHLRTSVEAAAARADAQADICAGWAADAPMIVTLRTTGMAPVPMGPVAPELEGDDAPGWHELPALAEHGVRRRRRLDLAREPDGGFRADSHFRDSYADGAGEMVMHEYRVTAELDPEQRIVDVQVEPLVLPWSECPSAVSSARAVIGIHARELPERIRAELAGPGTCTHLNSTLRCLADVVALVPAVPS